MGGLDLCYGRWDTTQHSIADTHPSDVREIVFPGQDYNNARIVSILQQLACRANAVRWIFKKCQTGKTTSSTVRLVPAWAGQMSLYVSMVRWCKIFVHTLRSAGIIFSKRAVLDAISSADEVQVIKSITHASINAISHCLFQLSTSSSAVTISICTIMETKRSQARKMKGSAIECLTDSMTK